MRNLILALLLLIASPAWGAVTFDAYTTDAIFSSDTLSTSHTVGGGCTNPYLVVAVHTLSQDLTHSSVSATAGSLTQIGTLLQYDDGAGSHYKLSLWGIAGATGVQSITITLSEPATVIYSFTRSYCGVNQATPLGTAATALTNTVNVSSAAGELVIDAMILRTSSTISATGGQTVRYAESLDFSRAAGSDLAGSGTTTMSWLAADAIIGVPLKPTAAAATRVRRRPVVFQ